MHTTQTDTLAKWILYSTVFITGAAVLIIEISAVRLLAVYFGNSLYVLSTILSVILAALALGYFFGGRIADRYPNPLVLYSIIGCAGVALLTVHLLGLTLFPILQGTVNLIWGPVVFGSFFCYQLFY